MLYASGTLSLACLEVLVHIKEPRLPADYGWVRIEIPSGLVEEASTAINGDDENLCRRFGSEWIGAARKPAIEVPSVIVPNEKNVLLNPLHADFGALSFSSVEPFRFDPRLLKLGPSPV
jgi:RES domain-containing protein